MAVLNIKLNLHTLLINTTFSLMVNNHRYQLKCLVEYHEETIITGHYTAAMEHNITWLQCDDLFMNPTKVHWHLCNWYILLFKSLIDLHIVALQLNLLTSCIHFTFKVLLYLASWVIFIL